MEENARSFEKEESARKLATAAFVLGIISLFASFCCCPFVFGALGVILAMASKGAAKEMLPKAQKGLIMSIIGLIASAVIVVTTVAMPFVLAKMNPAYANQFMKPYQEELENNESLYRQLYGDDVYKQMQEIFGVPEDADND